MKSLTEVVLSFFDMVEAEGKVFRDKAIVVASGIIAIFFGAFFLFVACMIGAAAGYMYLNDIFGDVLAILMVGGALAVIGLILITVGAVKK